MLPDPDGLRCVYARVPRIDRDVVPLLETSYADHRWDLGWLSGSWGLSGHIVHGLVIGDEPAVTCASALAWLLEDDRTFSQTRGRPPPGAPS